MSSLYGKLKGHSGKHQADALVACISTYIVHSADSVTAEWCQQRLGREVRTFFGGSVSPASDIHEDLFGDPKFTGSFNTHYEHILETRDFMVGRCGGALNNYLCDAVVLRSGEPFNSNGQNYLKLAFTQK